MLRVDQAAFAHLPGVWGTETDTAHSVGNPEKTKGQLNINTSDYLNLINLRKLDEEAKLQAEILTRWRKSNDQANFPRRISYGPVDNFGINFTRERYIKHLETAL